MTPDDLLELFDAAAAAVRDAVAAIDRDDMRDRTERPGQYALDLVADEAACAVLERAPVRIVSEESGVHGAPRAPITVVLDPVDGSTNCRAASRTGRPRSPRSTPTALLCALVVNQADRVAHDGGARQGGAFRDGVRLRASHRRRASKTR